MSKRKKIILVVIGIFIILAIIAFSFAVWTRNFTQTGVNRNTYDCLDIVYDELTDDMLKEHSYPMTDSDGMKTDPYTVKVTNNCPYVVSYNLYLNEMSTNNLNVNYVKIGLNEEIFMLNTKTSKTATISGTDTAWQLSSGVLGGGQSKTFATRMWMDENTTVSQGMDTQFNFKISIEAQTGGGNYLAGRILSDNELKTTTPDFNVAPTDATSGLYQMADDLGTSYYLRGNINNNYVKLNIKKYVVGTNAPVKPEGVEYYDSLEDAEEYGCGADAWLGWWEYESYSSCKADIVEESHPILFRVMRINGDGTIRLITEDSVGESEFNKTHQGHQYGGYTYNNSHNCTNNNPCSGSEGTASTIKTYIDNWYNTNLKSYEDKIANGDYCNDTSYSNYRETENVRYYGAYDRITSSAINPVLLCADTSVNYGGKYKLKVGLLTADEIALAGYNTKIASTTNNSYLEKDFLWWSFTPNDSDINTWARVFYAESRLSSYYTKNSSDVRPVINLKADTQVTSGNGTSSNPYVV